MLTGDFQTVRLFFYQKCLKVFRRNCIHYQSNIAYYFILIIKPKEEKESNVEGSYLIIDNYKYIKVTQSQNGVTLHIQSLKTRNNVSGMDEHGSTNVFIFNLSMYFL